MNMRHEVVSLLICFYTLLQLLRVVIDSLKSHAESFGCTYEHGHFITNKSRICLHNFTLSALQLDCDLNCTFKCRRSFSTIKLNAFV